MTAASWWRAHCNHAGALGLLASALVLVGCPDYHYSSRAFFANATRESVKVRVQELLANVDCVKAEGRSAELLADRKLFGKPVTYELKAGETLPLDSDDGASSTAPLERCAVLVQVIGFPDQLVFWGRGAHSVQTETTLAEANDPEFLEQSLTLEGHGDVKALAAGQGLEVTALPPLGSGTAAVSDAPAALGWSGAPPLGSSFTLLANDTLPDGCRSLRLGKEPATSWPLFLCAPDWAFPFAVNDELQVMVQELAPGSSSSGSSGFGADREGPRSRRLTISRLDNGEKLDIWLNAAKPQVAAVGPVLGLGGGGRRTACGAYVEPASVELLALKQVLVAGDEVEATIASRQSRVFLGRADDVLVAPDSCGTEYSSLGVRFDLLLLDTVLEILP
jgi:hypothetical protein